MSLIKNPNEIITTGAWAGLIYGEPGTGKSTLALSAPNPVMLDADDGMKRVQKRFQAPSLPMVSYRQVLELLSGNELDAFDTIVIDTLGKFVSFIGDWAIEQDPKNRKKGGGLAIAGYGAIKDEFARFVREIKKKKKYLLFIAHGREEKSGDVIKVRPDCPGSSGNDLVKELDFMGYVEMHGDDRHTISFSPNERYYGKNSLDLPAVIEIPNPADVGNTFIQKYIIEQSAKRATIEAEENAKFDVLMGRLNGIINTVIDAATADKALADINAIEPIWSSHRQAKATLNDKTKILGLVFNKEQKRFHVSQSPDAARPLGASGNGIIVQPGNAPLPGDAEKRKMEILTEALINGISECKTVASLNAYMTGQQVDFNLLVTSGAVEGQQKVMAAVDARRAALNQKAA